MDEESEQLSDESESELDIPRAHKTIASRKNVTDLKQPVKSIKPVLRERQEPEWTFFHHDTLAETDNSRNSTGYMKNVTEYKTNYFKQHNVENFVPQLNENIEKLFSDIKDSAQLPKQQLVQAPYASMNLDSMPLLTKKKLFENYYSSVKKYYMEDSSLFKIREQPPNLLKTLEDTFYEKEKISLKGSTIGVNTCDEVEVIAKLFYKLNNEIREISGLQKEVLKLTNIKKLKQLKMEAAKIEEEINTKIQKNMELKKEDKLRIPYNKDYGFTGYQPTAATHDEIKIGPKYPLFLTTNRLLADQQNRQVMLQKVKKETSNS